MSATITITIPTELEQRIASRAAAQGKRVEQVAAEALIMIFDQLDDYEATEISLQQVREEKTKPIREFLEELRQEFGFLRRDELQKLLPPNSANNKLRI